VKLKKVAGEKALELAKRPIPTRTHASDSGLPRQNLSSPEAMNRQDTNHATSPAKSVRREARKLDILNRSIKDGQKEYRRLKKSHGGMSDVWYSKKIAKSDLADGRSAETIRKHMTK
jgi:hypothetical protein